MRGCQKEIENTYDELLVELIGEQRVGKLAEVHLEQGADDMHVVYVDLLLNLVELLLIEGVAQALDVGLKARVTVDAIHDAVCLDELGANDQNLGHLNDRTEVIRSKLALGEWSVSLYLLAECC